MHMKPLPPRLDLYLHLIFVVLSTSSSFVRPVYTSTDRNSSKHMRVGFTKGEGAGFGVISGPVSYDNLGAPEFGLDKHCFTVQSLAWHA
jgi:hypothetical protein